MIELINKGGPINWIIVIIYFFVVGICIERGLYFYFTRVAYKEFSQRLFFLLRKPGSKVRQILEDEMFKKWGNSPIAKVVTAYLTHLDSDEALRAEVLEREGSIQVGKMENYLGALSVVGHIAPLLGLLGTMTGLIRAFQGIERLGGQVDVGVLSGGIWEAMLTTAFGLSLAIPAFLMFSFFTNLVNNRTDEISQLVSGLNIFFDKHAGDHKMDLQKESGKDDYNEIS